MTENEERPAIAFTLDSHPEPIVMITTDGRFILKGREVNTPEEIRDVMAEWCKVYTTDTLDHRRKTNNALNVALAHVEGRRGAFSTRDPRTVATIIRDALGTNVNEDRGRGGTHGAF